MSETVLGNLLPVLLATAWLLPLASFVLIVLLGPKMGKSGVLASYVATGAIVGACALSFLALGGWLLTFGADAPHHAEAAEHAANEAPAVPGDTVASTGRAASGGTTLASFRADEHNQPGKEHAKESIPKRAAKSQGASRATAGKKAFTDDWYVLGQFGKLRVTISYYIDALTVAMFAMVTLIASCIHFYAIGYMHDELHEVTDHEVTLSNGHHLHRPGRFHRFFQYLSLFCFSMLGLVVAGNIAMVFVFWELVGICSYFLIGFYIERKSASNAANKAFIVNRVGDFGMIIGLMALWASLGTFAFGDVPGQAKGIFSQVRPAAAHHAMVVPSGMVRADAAEEIGAVVEDHLTGDSSPEGAVSEIRSRVSEWRAKGYGYWLLVVAGLGIFCGCVGKSAQFPLHVWLPDAMEGPTPVSALVHSATMVAAGVYLVGRFYPVFSPEVLLAIAYVGGITLFLAATIAITATDIKRVLAYSTVSQLGYMMLGLGVGGWVAGLFHLITHAFFKSLLFLCSGSVIHACHTNEMPKMGGLRRKMPWTAYTMLAGCLAIIGAGLPFVIGFSGYYSKDAIIAQAMCFRENNPTHGGILFAMAAGGASLTAFYMFRLWYMTFAGEPRDHHVYDHAHESPKVMYMPLVILAAFAVGVGWTMPVTKLGVANLLEQARPETLLAHTSVHATEELFEEADLALRLESYEQQHLSESARYVEAHYVAEHASHYFHGPATLVASATALAGFLLATVFYGLRWLNPAEVRQQFNALYRFLLHKWYFDELYHAIFIRPTHFLAGLVAAFDKRVIDGLVHALARWVKGLSQLDDWIDRTFVDGIVNLTAAWTYSIGRSLRAVQTGRLRQYVMLIVICTVALTILINFAAAR